MKRYLVATLLLCNLASFSQTNTYEKAWKALNNNERGDAEKLLTEAMADPATASDAYITNIYLKSYNGKEKTITDFANTFYSKVQNPYPYTYALWFNDAVLGGYGKKTNESQLKLIDRIISDANAPGNLVAAANYQKQFHLLYSGEIEKLQPYADAVGNIRNWQYAGPFENLSESGFNKNYGPLEHPEPDAVFKSLTNADVKWFTPASENKDGWTPVSYQFNRSTAVIYAQSFVTSPAGQTVYCNVGFSGAIKVWINDEPVISESKERLTELDTYTIKYDLKKGINRVLVQLAFTNTSYPNFNVRFTDDKHNAIANITGSSNYAPYSKVSTVQKYKIIPHFAEEYFTAKIKEQPANPVNYLLLADVYIRSKKLQEAQDLMSGIIKKNSNNSILRLKMIENIGTGK